MITIIYGRRMHVRELFFEKTLKKAVSEFFLNQ